MQARSQKSVCLLQWGSMGGSCPQWSLWDVIIFTPDGVGSCWALTCFLTVELRL